MPTLSTDVIVVGAGLAGLVAAAEAADAGRHVVLLDQEGEQSLGGQAFWSLGGLFFVDSPEQRRIGIRDSRELAVRDWEVTAGFDRERDLWPRRWAEAYVDFAAGGMRGWLRALGLRWFPIVGWAERGGGGAGEPGNSVPRFHVTWGTGPAVVAPFERRVREHERAGRIQFAFRHRVRGLLRSGGTVVGVHGEVLEPTHALRGASSSRDIASEFEWSASAIVVASGGIGGNQDLVRRHWPVERLGPPPACMLTGVPEHVDGLLQEALGADGASLIHPDRMWHYTEGIRNWNPIWPGHGIRILPGPSSLWVDPFGARLPFPNIPGADTLGTLTHIATHRFPYTWLVLNRAIIRREFALSGSEQNPDLTGRSLRLTLARTGRSVQRPVQAFMDRGADFVVRDDLRALVDGMNALAAVGGAPERTPTEVGGMGAEGAQIGAPRVDYATLERELRDRDLQTRNRAGKDPQLAIIRGARRMFGERLARVARPAPILDPADGPLIAVRLTVLTRKTLGGLETDLAARVLGASGKPIPGLYAAGEVAGFGGGGMHGYR
ncbi:MAG: FAD-binding dehydrogenase, partial [Casimicrobiaceae bacterium]